MADGGQTGARERRRPDRWFVFGLLALFGALSVLIFLPFASYILMGLLLAYAASPLYRWLCRRLGDRRRVSAAVALLLVFAVVVGPVVYITFALVRDATQLAASLSPQMVRTFAERVATAAFAVVGQEPPPMTILGAELLTRVVPSLQAFVASRFSDIITFFTKLLVGTFVMAFVVFYGFMDGKGLVGYLRSIVPLDDEQTDDLVREVKNTVDAVFLGQIVASIAQGVLGGVAFAVFGVPNAVLWAFVMMVLAIIPVLGAFLIWAPAGVIMLLLGETTAGVAILVWGAVVVSNVDNVLKPVLIGSRARIHPVVVLVGVLGGLVVFGFIGFIVGPLVLSVFIAVLNFWREDYLPFYKASAASPPVGGGPLGAAAGSGSAGGSSGGSGGGGGVADSPEAGPEADADAEDSEDASRWGSATDAPGS